MSQIVDQSVAAISGAAANSGIPSVNHNLKNGNDSQQQKHRICRDFLRGQCRRMYCKYPHVQSPDSVVFCHDYQNSSCPRINCKFLHYTITEEDHYRKYGEFPQHEDFNPGSVKTSQQLPPDYADYYSSQLSEMAAGRPSSLHLNKDNHFNHQPCQRMDCSQMHNCAYPPAHSNGLKRGMPIEIYDNAGNKIKRSRDDEILAVLHRFEEDQSMLRRRVESNEIKIAELSAANEYLLNQNAQLRLTTVQCSRIVNPVTVTQTTSTGQSLQPQVCTVSMAPIQVATPSTIVTMSTPQSQLIATAIAATSQGQQISIPTNHLTTLSTSTQLTGQLAGQQISQITLAPALAINTSQALAISNATQPIISYPLMSHSSITVTNLA